MFAFIQAISQCGSSRLVHDTANSKTGNFTGFLGCLALSIVKIGRNGDHRFSYFLAQVIFSSLLHFLKYHGGNFLRGIQAAVYVNTYGIIVTFYNFIAPVTDLFCHLVKPATHEPFHRSDRVLGVSDGLALGRVAHFPFSVFQKSHY